MFFGQINAPATLLIYVLKYLMNSKFLGRLHRALRARLFFLMLYNEGFLLNLKNVAGERQVTL